MFGNGFYGGVFGVGGSNGAISGLTKSTMATQHNLKYFLLNHKHMYRVILFSLY